MVLVDKQDLIRIFACCRQAQMSVHRILPFGDVWREFQQFYSERRRGLLNNCLEQLGMLLPPETAAPSREQVERTARWLPFTSRLRSVVNGRRPRLAVSADHLAYIDAALKQFRSFLDQPQKPNTHEIIAMRTELYTCQWLTRAYLAGDKAADAAQHVEHFNQSDYRQHVAIDEIVPLLEEPAKRSA
ncbi:MAG: hypothetical protein KY475_13555 [Planctomycetes bacterium]|nr:hypothetical protein [Planctomycetota bacterium]